MNSLDQPTIPDQEVIQLQSWFSLLSQGGGKADQAFSLIFDAYAEKFMTYLLSRRLSHHQAEDIVNECFIKLLKLRGSDLDIDNPRAYLWRMLNNELINSYRKESRQNETELNNNAEHFEGINCKVEDQNYLSCVESVYANFKRSQPKQVEAFELAVYGGLNLKEIAEILGKKHGAIRQSVSAARKTFSSLVSQFCGVEPKEALK